MMKQMQATQTGIAACKGRSLKWSADALMMSENTQPTA